MEETTEIPQNASNKLCLICCVSYCPATDEPTPLHKNKSFNKFCKQLEQDSSLLLSKSFNGSAKYSTELLLKSLKSLKQNSLSVCPECVEYLNVAVDARVQAEVVEVKVLTLQAELLEALKELRGKMGTYYREMTRVGELVKISDGTCLELQMEGGGGGGGTSGGGRRRKTRSRAEEGPNGVVLFRNAIVSVTTEVEGYVNDLDKKFDLNLDHQTQVTSSGRPRRSSSKQQAQVSTPTTSNLTAAEVEPIPVDVEFGCKIEVDTDLTNDDPNDAFEDFVDNPVQDEGWSAGEFDSANDEELAVPEENTDDETGEDSDDNDYSPTMNTTKKQKLSNSASTPSKSRERKSSKYHSDLETLKLEELTGFRRRLVKRIIKKDRYRHFKGQTVNTDDALESCHFKLTKQFPIEYDREQGTVVIGGVTIHIDETAEHLECSLCGYHSKPQGQTCKREAYMDRAIWNHVVGKHLNAIKCPLCSKIVMALPHLRKHLNDHKADSLDCEICGKPMASLQSLAGHRWTHMNEEERNECESRGMKNPLKKAVREFQCSTCGKELKGRESFEKHQLVHQQDREKVICPKCGKLLFRTSLHSYHLKYACRANDETPQRIPCGLCDVTFKTSVQKKKHMARMHNPAAALRPYTCPHCQKTFKTDDCLRGHLRTHNTSTQFFCSKGCGSSFRVKRYCTRHEKNCKSFAKVECSF